MILKKETIPYTQIFPITNTNMYDLIIIWWWASGLFCSINASKNSKKLIIEKQNSLWNKILLSGWWRCNFTNLNIDPDRYFWQNKKMLASVFHKYSNYDFMNYLDENWIKYNIEDNGRVILKSWKSKELLDFLIKKSEENNAEIQTWHTITKVKKENDFFKITTEQSEFLCKNLVISTWWISYPQIWATSFWIDIAKQFWLKIIPSFPALCWLEVKTDFSSLTWSSISWKVEILDWNKTIYENQWNILFTHRWLSGPAIFNCSAWLAEYMTKKQWKFNIKITPNEMTKKLEKFLDSSLLTPLKTGLASLEPSTVLCSEWQQKIITQITNFRPLEEAKVSSGWVDMDEIKPNFECKKVANLFFIWECLDIIGKTWWFNLQRAWSSGAICGQNF